MNIEEERKAFELTLESKEESATSFLLTEYRYAAVKHDIKEALFESWLAAKKHAEEMANRQEVSLNYANGGYYFCWYDDFGVYQQICPPGLHSAEEARVWATNNGYRVIEE